MSRNLSTIWIIFFHFFYCYTIEIKNLNKINNRIKFWCCRFVLMHLILSFLFIRSLLVPYAYTFIESIDCILLLSFELKAILLISLLKTLCLSLLNLCCVFNFTFFYFVISLRLSTSILLFVK